LCVGAYRTTLRMPGASPTSKRWRRASRAYRFASSCHRRHWRRETCNSSSSRAKHTLAADTCVSIALRRRGEGRIWRRMLAVVCFLVNAGSGCGPERVMRQGGARGRGEGGGDIGLRREGCRHCWTLPTVARSSGTASLTTTRFPSTSSRGHVGSKSRVIHAAQLDSYVYVCTAL
jgi:hypothetical protein